MRPDLEDGEVAHSRRVKTSAIDDDIFSVANRTARILRAWPKLALSPADRASTSASASSSSAVVTYSPATIYVCHFSNRFNSLSSGPLNEDLFSIVGELKRYNVHYDRSERSKETEDVVFARRVDALAAIKKYNNVQLDGKAMKIEIVGKNI